MMNCGLLSCIIVSTFLALTQGNAITDQVNVNGGPLKICSKDPMTGNDNFRPPISGLELHVAYYKELIRI